MPIAGEIEQFLFTRAPRAGAMEWDNVGLLLGDPTKSVTRCLVALDITEAVADEAVSLGCQLIVSHHPLMNCHWLPVQSVREDTRQGHLLRKLLRHDVAAICMHTNLDVAEGGVNDILAQTLGLEGPGVLCENGLGRVGTLPAPMALRDFARFVSRTLGCNGLRFSDAGRPVSRVAVGGGACGDCIAPAIAAGCDTFVTADLSYHQFLDTGEINLIDAGHFPTENPVCAALVDALKEQFPQLSVIKSASHREVIQYYVEGE
ncbi:Nif3-like dinuclear metal center hexameric protein [Oscillibacter sp.]|uniref:Nif3-like dinuclear metal center hexameric protein n=1 Tax=Oscillibacter sp. TaxID=1945593 RepID=UPI002624F9FA|nr:Nif3-like dinuclear metal center hexameric protein [Oscillibacter sp.]MDD3346442.1 Nif3-like dinuclear metal center hexameric protein [Oscillibacter sp.]